MKIDLLQSTAMSKQAVKSRTESEQEIMKTPSSVRPVGQAGMHARLGLFTPPKLVIISAQPYHTHPDSSSNAPLLTSDLLQEPQNDPNDNKDAAPPVIPDCIIQELYQIGFFNPDYKAPENIQRFTRNRDGFYVYWDVFAFTARVQQHIRTKESRKEDLEALSQVLPYCLQKSAWTWWDQEVEEHRKEIFMSVPVSYSILLSPCHEHKPVLEPYCLPDSRIAMADAADTGRLASICGISTWKLVSKALGRSSHKGLAHLRIVSPRSRVRRANQRN